MSEFPALDDFNDFAAPGGGSQSDFLARERELLGEEFGPTPGGLASASDFSEKPRGSGAFPSLDDDDDLGRSSSPKVTSPTSSSTRQAAKPSSDFVSSFQREPPPAAKPSSSVAIANDDEDGDNENDTAMLHFQSQYPDLQPYPDVQASAQVTSAPQQNGHSTQSTFTQPLTQSSQSTEPESDAIREWRERQREEIETRDQKSSEKREENIRKAEAAIDDFYHTYNQKKEKQIAQNKENEAAFTRARDDALGKGTTWERIADIIELQDSRSKTISKGTKDVTRMKEILLSLKREGENAPNAMGY